MDQDVIDLFHASIQAKMQAGEELAPAIAEASQLLVHALLQEKRIFTGGNGICGAQAQIFTSALLNRFDRERPGLPAIHLGSDWVSQSAIASDHSFNDTFAKPLRALGQPGDVLLLVTTDGHDGNLLQAISAAHDRELSVIALTGRDGGDAAALLDGNDRELRAGLDAEPRIHEVHLLTLFCLCDLIDRQIFGSHH